MKGFVFATIFAVAVSAVPYGAKEADAPKKSEAPTSWYDDSHNKGSPVPTGGPKDHPSGWYDDHKDDPSKWYDDNDGKLGHPSWTTSWAAPTKTWTPPPPPPPPPAPSPTLDADNVCSSSTNVTCCNSETSDSSNGSILSALLGAETLSCFQIPISRKYTQLSSWFTDS